MTIKREDAKELLPIVKALAEGKMIQDSIDGSKWFDTDEINLEYEGQKIKHRIKPEPKYRLFKTKKECWNEMMKHKPFGWLTSKKTDNNALIFNCTLTDRNCVVYYTNKTTKLICHKCVIFKFNMEIRNCHAIC